MRVEPSRVGLVPSSGSAQTRGAPRPSAAGGRGGSVPATDQGDGLRR